MSVGKIHCCLCGVLIEPNEAAMCLECLQLQTDITEGIANHGTLIQCGKCDRWMSRTDHWVKHHMESNSLLAMCLKKINGLQRPGTKILDAGFIWTEPHSMRIKVFVNISRGVLDNKVQVKQKLEVEFVIRHKQCLECIREATDHSWGAMIQIRQHVGHKKSFYQLERLLGDAKLHNLMLSIEVVREGIDFYFKSKNLADKVAEFISGNMPTKIKHSKKLVSQDKQSNTSKHEHTMHMEVIPLCKGDLVLTPKEYTGIQEVMIVTKLTSNLHLLNPTTMKPFKLSALEYFSKPFPALMNTHALITFVVLDIRIVNEREYGSSAGVSASAGAVSTAISAHASVATGGGAGSGAGAAGGAGGASGAVGQGETTSDKAKLKSIRELGGILAEATVARESDLGENDNSYVVFTHLGHVLQPGDLVLGYDVQHSVLTAQGEAMVERLNFDLPDVILVRKSYPESTKTRKRNKNKPSWMKNTSAADGNKRGSKKSSSADPDAEDVDKIEFLTQLEDESAFIEEENALFPALLSQERGQDLPPVPPVFNEATGEWEDVKAGDAAGEGIDGNGTSNINNKSSSKRVTIATSTLLPADEGESTTRSQFLSPEELAFLEASLIAPNVEGAEDYEVVNGGDMEEDEDEDEEEGDDEGEEEDGEEESESENELQDDSEDDDETGTLKQQG